MSNDTKVRVENLTCAECGMLVGPVDAFHPYLYCWLFKAGVKDPSRFLSGHGFAPDPTAKVNHILDEWADTMKGDDVRTSVVRGMAHEIRAAIHSV